jgi:DNA-binding GntR family transcriptional regulator
VDLVAQAHGYHCQILDAVMKRKPESASRLMREHVQLSLKERLAEYQQEWTGTPLEGLEIF